MKKTVLMTFAIIVVAVITHAQPNMNETVLVIKASLVQSKVNMKNYSWLETTKTWINGELKSTQQNQCYYSVDGKLIKIVTGNSDQQKTPGGIRGKIIENKKEELSEYIAKGMDKIKAYLPPDDDKLQKIYDAGKVAIQILEPGKKFKLSFSDYLQSGDLLSISLDMTSQKLMALMVNTWIENPSDKVTFDVTYNTLPDGTQYAALTELIATAKNLKIEIEESGFRKGAGQ
jgi:hypothetical protein